MTSSNYYLDVEKGEVADHVDQTSLLGLALGQSDVKLKDKHMAGDEDFVYPTAELHVVEPAYIALKIEPHNNWNVIVGEDYTLSVDVFTQDNHRLFPSANLVVDIQVDSHYFATESRSFRSVDGKPVRAGSVEVQAVLTGTKHPKTGEVVGLKTPLKTKVVMEIFEPIVLQPALSVFAWDPVSLPQEQVVYKIGSASQGQTFRWSADNATLVSLTQNGVARTSGLHTGDVEIVAAMNRAAHNRGSARIVIRPALDLDWVKNVPLESTVGSELQVPLQFFADVERRIGFTKCNQLPYT